VPAPQFYPTIRNTGPKELEEIELAADESFRVTRRGALHKLEIAKGWRAELRRLWDRYPIEEVFLNGMFGWSDPDISFLRDLPNLKGLSLYPHSYFTWNTVEYLKALEELQMPVVPRRPEIVVDFSALQRLRRVRVHWWPEWSSLLTNGSVQSLAVQDSKKLRALECGAMTSLRELRLIRCDKCEILRLSASHKLLGLEVSLCPKFANVVPDSCLASLEYLWIHGPIAFDYLRVRNFSKLRQITLDNMGKLPSLRFLGELKNLDYLAFGLGTVVLDGDLTFLDHLPELKAASYDKSHKNYFPKRSSDWWEMLKSRRAGAGWTF